MKAIPLILLVFSALACTLTNSPAAQNIRPTDPPTGPAQLVQIVPTAAITCTITAMQSLNLRAGPGTSAAVIAVLKRGDVLTILPHPDEGNWIRVKAESLEGWINKNYCETKGN
jgi:uncharacterized protein YgiM (DUF1202 family)